MPQYEAIFHGQTSATQVLTDKAAWIASLSLDETEIEEPDKVAKFTAACIRLATASKKLDLFITDSLNRFNYEVLHKTPETALALATASGEKWKDKKKKDLELVKNLQSVSSWNALFEGVDKEKLIQIIKYHYTDNVQFRLSVDYAATQRTTYITELALKNKLSPPIPVDEMLDKFRTYVVEECAGVIALRLRKYTNAFYLAKLNQATAVIATTIFPLRHDEAAEETNGILNEINQTVLTFHTPSQYKQLSKNNPTLRKNSKNTPVPSNLPASASTNDDGRKAAFAAFFDSTQIPLEIKVRFLAALTGSSLAVEIAPANAKDFDNVPSSGGNAISFTKTGGAPSPPASPLPVEPT